MSPEPILQLRSLIRPYDDVEHLASGANNPKVARRMRNTSPQPYTPNDANA